MVERMIKDVEETRDEFLNKFEKIPAKDLIKVKNTLTGINISIEKMSVEKENIYKAINDIRNILKSIDDKKQDS